MVICSDSRYPVKTSALAQVLHRDSVPIGVPFLMYALLTASLSFYQRSWMVLAGE
jgi:hypothetical protein